MRIGLQMSETVTYLNTNRSGKKVRVEFSVKTQKISAAVLHKNGRFTPIKPYDIPKEFQKIKSLALFKLYFADAFATIGTFSDGGFSLQVSQRGRGGAPPVDEAEMIAEAIHQVSEGTEKISQATIKPDLLILVGRTSAGKSLLGNLLSGVELVGRPAANGTFKFDPIDPIMPVGESNVASCTRCPNLHSPDGVEYTIVDLPGFGDTGGPIQDITNGFYRSQVTKSKERMKFLLVVQYQDVYGGDNYFADTMEDLIKFLGCCRSQEGMEKAAESIILVITKVAQPVENTSELEEKIEAMRDRLEHMRQHPSRYTDDLIRSEEEELEECESELARVKGWSIEAEVREKLAEHLKDDSRFSPQAQTLLRLLMDRVVIFSAPSHVGANEKALHDKQTILTFVNRTNPLAICEAAIQTKAPDPHDGWMERLITAFLKRGVKETFVARLLGEVDARIKTLFNTGDETAFIDLRDKLRVISHTNSLCTLADLGSILHRAVPLLPAILDQGKQVHAVLKTLVDLSPDHVAIRHPIRHSWLEESGLRLGLERRIAFLNKVIAPATITEENGMLTLKGYFPKTSQIKASLLGASTVKEVDIYALHTAHLDVNLDDGKLAGVNVFIIAPRWRIDRSVEFVLSGAQRNDPFAEPAPDGQREGEAGGKGDPGLPGLPGGRFLGIGKTVPNSDRVMVTSKGGTGGTGQDGGGGCSAKSGVDAIDERTPSHKGGTWSKVYKQDSNNNQYHINDGELAVPGGDGGQPGRGGVGGLPGSVELIVLSTPNAPIGTKLGPGSEGDSGLPGAPGAGAANGLRWAGSWNHRDKHWNGGDLPRYYDQGVTPSGAVPNTFNKDGRKSAEEAEQIKEHLKVLSFKGFAIEESSPWTAEFLETFRQEFEDCRALRSKATIEKFIEECLEIEKMYLNAEKKQSCLPLYLSVYGRLQEYIRVTGNISTDDIVRLQHLCNHTLSKICQLNAGLAPRLIVNISGFLEGVLQNFDELSSLVERQMVEAYKREFEGDLRKRINEGDVFLEQLNGDILAAQREASRLITAIIGEVRALIQAGEGGRAQLVEKRKELNDLLAKKALMGGLSVAVQAIGCCIPGPGPILGAIAAAAIHFFANPSIPEGISQGAIIVSHVANLELMINSPPPEINQRHLNTLIRIRDISAAVGAMVRDGGRLKQEINAGEDQLREIERGIRETDAQIERLHQFEVTFPRVAEEQLQEFVKQTAILQKELKNHSVISRDHHRYTLKGYFDAIKGQFQASTMGLVSGDGLLLIVQQVQDALETSLTIHDRIQDYEDRIQLANYMGNLAAPAVGVQDSRLNQLYLKAQHNVVLEQYSRVIAAVRQWSFPFGLRFLRDFADLQQFSSAANFEDIVVQIRRRLLSLQTRLTNYFSEVQADIDGALTRATFLQAPPFTPFCIWTAAEFKNQMVGLFRGRTVVLPADIRRSATRQSVIKFKEVALQFRCADEALQRELERALFNYKIQLYHSGQSFYRFRNEVYQISSEDGFHLSYTYARRNENDSLEHNEAYHKMKQGVMMLSPYTNWGVQLTPLAGECTLFETFGDRLDQIELHLVGEGQFVNEAQTTRLELDPSYAALRVQ